MLMRGGRYFHVLRSWLRRDEFDDCSEGGVYREYFELLEDSIMLIFADILDCGAGNTDGSERFRCHA